MSSIGNPESAHNAAAYRGLLPERTRYRISKRFTPEGRSQVKPESSDVAVIPRQIDRFRASRATSRRRDLFAGPDRIPVAVAVDHQAVAAFVHDTLTTRHTHRENLDAVTHALEEAGIDHSCIRSAYTPALGELAGRAITSRGHPGATRRKCSRSVRATRTVTHLMRAGCVAVTQVSTGRRLSGFSVVPLRPFDWRAIVQVEVSCRTRQWTGTSGCAR
ncbi:hypothetical protein [Streptomyces sp. NPDC001020]